MKSYKNTFFSQMDITGWPPESLEFVCFYLVELRTLLMILLNVRSRPGRTGFGNLDQSWTGHRQYKPNFLEEKIEKFYSFEEMEDKIRSWTRTKFHYCLDAGIPVWQTLWLLWCHKSFKLKKVYNNWNWDL